MDKTTRNPTDHELNEVLARVASVEIWLTNTTNVWMVGKHGIYSGVEWNPLHDANQMERVKAKLRDGGHSYNIIWDADYKYCCVQILYADSFNYKVARDPGELRAFALAVYAMEQPQKGTT